MRDIWAGPGGCSWPGLPPYYSVTAPWQLLHSVPHNKLVAEAILLLVVWEFYLLILKDNFFHFPSPVSDISAPPFKYSVKGVPVRSHIVRRIASGLLLVSWWWQTVVLISCILCCCSLINFRGLLTGHQPSSISPAHTLTLFWSSRSNEPGKWMKSDQRYLPPGLGGKSVTRLLPGVGCMVVCCMGV